MEQQLAEAALRLGASDRQAGPVGEMLGLAGRGESPVVLVEVAQRDGLVDLQQQPQVGQRGLGLGDRQGPVVEGQCVRRPPLRSRT